MINLIFYNNEELKTKEDCILLFQEIQAYRELENAEFNFNGVILRNDNEYKLGSEDVYYEMNIQDLEDILCYWECYNDIYRNDGKYNKHRINKYNRKLINKDKLKRLSKYNESIYYHEDKDWYEKCYMSSVRSYDKYCSKKIRHRNGFSLKGSNYKKVYNSLRAIR